MRGRARIDIIQGTTLNLCFKTFKKLKIFLLKEVNKKKENSSTH